MFLLRIHAFDIVWKRVNNERSNKTNHFRLKYESHALQNVMRINSLHLILAEVTTTTTRRNKQESGDQASIQIREQCNQSNTSRLDKQGKYRISNLMLRNATVGGDFKATLDGGGPT